MGNTLSGYQVQYGTTNAVQNYNAFGYPTAILGKTPSGLPFPLNCDASGNLIVTATISPSGTQDVNLTKVGGTAVALGQAVAASSIPVVLPASQIAGAGNLITSQVTSTGSAATLAIARATRRSVLFTNTSATGSVRIGPATVTAGNGQILGPGQSCPFTWVGLFQVIDDGATHCVVCVADEYD